MKTIILLLATIFVISACSESPQTEEAASTTKLTYVGEYSSQPFVCTEDHAGDWYRNTSEGKAYICSDNFWYYIVESESCSAGVSIAYFINSDNMD